MQLCTNREEYINTIVEKGAWMQGNSNGGIINLRMAGLEYDVIIKCKDEMIEKKKKTDKGMI